MTDWQLYLYCGICRTSDRLNWYTVEGDYLADDGFGNLLPVYAAYLEE